MRPPRSDIAVAGMKLIAATTAIAVTASVSLLLGLVGLVAIVTGGVGSNSRVADGVYSLPIPSTAISTASLVEAHHDYAAWDGTVPVDTPVLAMTSGVVTTVITAGVYPADPNRCGNTIVIVGDDGASYVYCHLSAIDASEDMRVAAGQQIGLSGGAPGTVGAGNTTGPHLHLAVRTEGTPVCPQPLLLAIAMSRPITPSAAPSTGCVSGATATDWSRWLDLQPNPEYNS